MKLLVWAPGSAIIFTSSNGRHKYWVDGGTAEEAGPWEWKSNKAGGQGPLTMQRGMDLALGTMAKSQRPQDSGRVQDVLLALRL